MHATIKMATKDVRISFRVTKTLADLVKKFVQLDTHMNESDFYRDAAREKIQKEAPDLYCQLFEEKGGVET